MSHCSQNPFDPNCSCTPAVGTSKQARTFDPESQKYICCGSIPFSVTGTNLASYVQSIPESSGVCSSWWNNLLTNEGSTSDRLKMNNLLALQDHISSVMTPATVSTDGKTITCPAGRLPRRAKIPNTSKGTGVIDLLICTGPGTELTSNPDFNNSGSSIYLIDGCSTQSNVCTLETSVYPLPNKPGPLEAVSLQPVKTSTVDTIEDADTIKDEVPAAVTEPLFRLTNPLTGKTLSRTATNSVLGIVLASIIVVVIIGIIFYMTNGREARRTYSDPGIMFAQNMYPPMYGRQPGFPQPY